MEDQNEDKNTPNATDQNVDEVLTVVLGETLKRRRLELGYSMEKLSQLSTVSRGMLGLIESGKTTPSIGILWKLSKTLRIPIGEMIPDLFSQSPRLVPATEGKTWSGPKNIGKSRIFYQEDRERLNLIEWSLEKGKVQQFQHLPQAQDIKLYQVQGATKVVLKQKSYFLETGDSVFFPISELVCIENERDELSKLLWISSKKFR